LSVRKKENNLWSFENYVTFQEDRRIYDSPTKFFVVCKFCDKGSLWFLHNEFPNFSELIIIFHALIPTFKIYVILCASVSSWKNHSHPINKAQTTKQEFFFLKELFFLKFFQFQIQNILLRFQAAFCLILLNTTFLLGVVWMLSDGKRSCFFFSKIFVTLNIALDHSNQLLLQNIVKRGSQLRSNQGNNKGP